MDTTLPPAVRALYPFASNFHEVREGRIHYLDEGTGPVVVMVHGNPTWSFLYRDLIRELRTDHRCIAIDHLGCGLSDKPATGTYRLEAHLDNLAGLLGHLGITRFSLVVHDWGGPIGLGACAAMGIVPERSVIMNTAAFRSRRVPLRIRLCRAPLFGGFLVRSCNGFAGPAAFMAVRRRRLPPDVRAGFLFPYQNWHDRVAVSAFVADIPDREGHPSHPALVRIEKSLIHLDPDRVLLAWGGADFCFNRDFLEEWQIRLPGVRTRLVADAGHYLLEDAGEEVIPAIRNFLTAG
ncbi:MAG: alpha/beta fold hydrolase [Opitutaceae bacterium]